MRVLVTGSSGLIGSEAVQHFDDAGHMVDGIDNNMRREFFGPQGDTTWNLQRLMRETRHFTPHGIDIRDRQAVAGYFRQTPPELIIHCAAQPSHDKARDIPFDALATLGCAVLTGVGAVMSCAHVPPLASGLDTAYEIDDQLRIVVRNGKPHEIAVGSSAVRQVLEEFQPLLDFLKSKLPDIKEARLTSRLKESAVCLVAEEGAMSAHMERILERLQAQPRLSLTELFTEPRTRGRLLGLFSGKARRRR